MMTAAEKFDMIKNHLAHSRTVYISTHLSRSVITPATAERWAKSGRELFKVSGGSLYMARGAKAYDCIDYCRFDAR